jgi:flagellin-like protein
MRKIKNMLEDKTGVSPIIAIILMVAITVVLAATIYVWVSGFGGETGESKNSIAMNKLSSSETLNTWIWQVADVEGTMLITDLENLVLDENGTVVATADVDWNDNDNDTYVTAGDTVVVAPGADGVYNYVCNHEDATIYTSGYRKY